MIERKSNMELLRVAAMFYIVASHIVGHCVFQIYGGGGCSIRVFLPWDTGKQDNRRLVCCRRRYGKLYFFPFDGIFQ